MTNDTLLPFEFMDFAPNYDRYVAEEPLANGVKNGFVTTKTTKIVVLVTEEFLNANRVSFIVYAQNGSGPFGSGTVDENKRIEVEIPFPLEIGVSYTLYAADEGNTVNGPTIIIPYIPE